MTAGDYEAIGFKSGLEIHQQLLTAKKLFCRCPAGKYSEEYNAEILRHMRPTLSELGEYDGTALMEFKTRKEIIYQINRETVCTYEMDDTPPFELNEEALDIALGIGLLYRCAMVDEIHIARKQYLDGSIPTGFQRTTIVGVDGQIPLRDRTIRIVQLGLEEDACREVSDVGHRRVYRTDRLGMPLIETVTAPDMRTPKEVAEVAEILRKLVRGTRHVRTGAGAAREDVNVSVTGGTRIEIKGVPSIASIPLLTHNEAMRQWNLLRLKDELGRRNVTTGSFASKTDDVTRLLRRTRYEPIRNALAEGATVKCVLLCGFRGLLTWQTQTDTVFSREISDRVRVIACLTTLPNIIHSDSSGETLASSEWHLLKKTVGATDDDAIVVVWGPAADAETGAKEVAIRAKEAAIGIPSETRQALRDGTNGFERILPGPDRMYPDTDLPPKRIAPERLERIRNELRPAYWHIESWYRTLGIPADTIDPLCFSPLAPLFETAVKEWKLNPTLVAVALIQYPKRLKNGSPDMTMMNDILMAFRDRRISKEGILPVMSWALRTGRFDAGALPPLLSVQELNERIERNLEVSESLTVRHKGKELEMLVGMMMQEVRGRIDGALVAQHCAAALRKVGA